MCFLAFCPAFSALTSHRCDGALPSCRDGAEIGLCDLPGGGAGMQCPAGTILLPPRGAQCFLPLLKEQGKAVRWVGWD